MNKDLPLTDREAAFLLQSDIFIERALQGIGASNVADAPEIANRPPTALRPTLIGNYQRLSALEVAEIVRNYRGEHGVAYFVVDNAPGKSPQHPLLSIADQLSDALNLQHPISHPLEAHPEVIKRFGATDHTVKLYDLNKNSSDGYREQGETSEPFAAHNDGLGYAGTVRTTAMYLDTPPLWGGFTYFTNIVLLSLSLASEDRGAFRSLFLPNAITAIRPRGKGAIKVTSPILFLNASGEPSVFFRLQTGEYQIRFRDDIPALSRAIEFLTKRTGPFGLGSTFVHFSSKGQGCFARNQQVVHGRTEFADSQEGNRRVLARKWFMSADHHTIYKHVPGIEIHSDYSGLFPEYFGSDLLIGEWQYEVSSDVNRRLR